MTTPRATLDLSTDLDASILEVVDGELAGMRGELAAALIWGSERTLYVAGLAVTNDLPHEDRALRALQAFWRDAVYGSNAVTPTIRLPRGGVPLG